MKILVLDACAMHLGFLGCYGNEWVATPALDRLACQAIVFDQHFVETPKPALDKALHHNIFREGVQVDHLVVPQVLDLTDRVLSHLARLAKAENAMLYVAGPTLAPPWNLPADQLVSYFDENEEGALSTPWPDPPDGRVPLTEYDLLRLQNTYAAVVTAWDAQLETLLDHLDQQPWADELVLVLTAQSGFPLGEHGQIGFAHPWLYEEAVHVPLIIRLPDRSHAGRRVGALTCSTDLPSVLEPWLSSASSENERLLQLLNKNPGTEDREVVSCWRIGQEEEWAARTKDWALLWPRASSERPIQLYAKPEDRWEVNNLAKQQWEMVEAWKQRLVDEININS